MLITCFNFCGDLTVLFWYARLLDRTVLTGKALTRGHTDHINNIFLQWPWSMTLQSNLTSTVWRQTKQRAKYLCQLSFSPKVILNTQKNTHTNRTDCSNWPTEVVQVGRAVHSLGLHQYLNVSLQMTALYLCYRIIMIALCNRADHYIFALWFLSFFLSFFLFLA